MKQVTKLLINDFKIKELGYDFMGYSLLRYESYTFHHLILSHEYCKKFKLGKGYWYENGVILCERSHEFLHVIELLDYDLFLAITSEMIDMKIKGYLCDDNIQTIWQIIEDIKSIYIDRTTNKNKLLIKDIYLQRK